MRLDQALVTRGLVASRTEAQELIERGVVLVDGAVVTKQIKQVTEEESIEVLAGRKFVSRGGEKLAGAFFQFFEEAKKGTSEQFSMFNFQFSNKETNAEALVREFLHKKIAIDVGSSTGGFTDFLLQHGIEHVDAVDVGTSQLHDKVRHDERVSVYENTDIRNFDSQGAYDVIVADLSFISLESVFEKIVSFGKPGAIFFLLIKPQFEVGKGNTKKGIVKDQSLIDALLEKYQHTAEEVLDTVHITPCVLKGGGGNQEYFLIGRKK